MYADTSVYGGCFDKEFQAESFAFFREVAAGRFLLIIAEVTVRELALALEPVRKVLAQLPKPVRIHSPREVVEI